MVIQSTAASFTTNRSTSFISSTDKRRWPEI